MTTTTQIIIATGIGVGGFILYKKFYGKNAVSSTVGKSPTGAGTSTQANWWDQLSQAFGGKPAAPGGSASDAQAAAGIIGALGSLASGIGSAVKGIGEWQSSGSDSVGATDSGVLSGVGTATDASADPNYGGIFTPGGIDTSGG
jgi:hypothetical protein